MNSPRRVDIVIPTFNRRDDLVLTLDGIAAQGWPADDLVVHVVDNGSTDGTGAMLAAQSSRWPFRVVHVPNEPRGPAFARNVGAARGSALYIAFIDSDVTLEARWLANAVAALEADPTIGLVGGKVLYDHEPDRLNAYGGELSAIGLGWDALEGEPAASADAPADRLWINCTACLVRRETLEATGGFDAEFFYGYEDSDFGWRACLAGWRAVVRPDLACRHRTGTAAGHSSPQIVFHYTKNRLRSVLRNRGTGGLPAMLGGYLLYALLDMAVRTPRRAKLRALLWNLRNLGATLALRRATQSGRRVPESTVDRLLDRRWLPSRALGGLRRRVIPGAETAPMVADDRVLPR
ncbi:MAG: glycosyltransferase family 2 protein [Alphaproteobacteria bacterium]|nr:glycosyltransferase family 2 protein [Alphaproteobacteria bacterium]